MAAPLDCAPRPKPVPEMCRARSHTAGGGSMKAVAIALLLLTLSSSAALAAPAPAHAPSAKAVSLSLADVRQVLGHGLTNTYARNSTPHALGVCTTTPPVAEYDATYSAPLGTKGVLEAISDVYTYTSAAGPACHLKFDMSEHQTLGDTLGKMSTIHGVGEHAFLLDTTGPKTKEAPVYTLGLNFSRGLYRGVIIVQSNRTIKASDMIKLGKVMDGRMQRTR
jgi:hypothetical protein